MIKITESTVDSVSMVEVVVMVVAGSNLESFVATQNKERKNNAPLSRLWERKGKTLYLMKNVIIVW